MAIINGRRIDPNNVPNGGMYGQDLVRGIAISAGRRPVIQRGGHFEPLDQNKRYAKHELQDRQGRGVKVTSIPDRSKGGFGGNRSRESKQIITEQVVDIATHLFKRGVDFDENDAHSMVVPRYPLPPCWHHIARSTALMVCFPTEYPVLPPVGFYMMADIPASPDGHFFQAAYHDAWQEPINHGWKWYCIYIHQGQWQPARNWKEGDNLYTYFTLISEALANGG